MKNLIIGLLVLVISSCNKSEGLCMESLTKPTISSWDYMRVKKLDGSLKFYTKGKEKGESLKISTVMIDNDLLLKMENLTKKDHYYAKVNDFKLDSLYFLEILCEKKLEKDTITSSMGYIRIERTCKSFHKGFFSFENTLFSFNNIALNKYK